MAHLSCVKYLKYEDLLVESEGNGWAKVLLPVEFAYNVSGLNFHIH